MVRNFTRNETTRRTVLKLSATGASALLGGLAGCLGGNTNSTGTESGKLVTTNRVGSKNVKATSVHWLLPDASHKQDENPEVAKVYEQLFETWAKDHPRVAMDLQYKTNLEQMKTKLLQAVAKGNAPTSAQVDSFWVPDFTDSLQPMDRVIEEPDDWYPFVKDIVHQNGSWRAVWKNTDCRALYYRQDLIDKYNGGNPPKTWDELIQVGKDIKENENMAGYMYNGGKWEATTFDNLAMYWAQGGNLVNDEGKPVLDAPENKRLLLSVFKFFKRTVDSGVTPQRVVNITDYGRLREAALNGQTAMFLGGNWQISTIKQQVDSKEEWKKWKVAKIPQRKPDIASTGTGGWTVGVFSQDETKRSAAVDYAGLFAKKTNMANLCKAGGFLPTRKSVFEETKFFSDDPYMQKYKELLTDGRARPGVPIYLTISSEWQTAVGKVLTGQAAPKAAVNTMIKNVNAEYEG